jgi:hypothetical protein
VVAWFPDGLILACRVLHRDVRIVLDGVDKYNNLFGSVFYSEDDVAQDLALQLVSQVWKILNDHLKFKIGQPGTRPRANGHRITNSDRWRLVLNSVKMAFCRVITHAFRRCLRQSSDARPQAGTPSRPTSRPPLETPHFLGNSAIFWACSYACAIVYFQVPELDFDQS